MRAKLSEILSEFTHKEGLFSSIEGEDVEVTGIGPVEAFAEGDLVFLGDAKFLKQLGEKMPRAAVVSKDSLEAVRKKQIPCLVSSNVNLAQALLKQHYVDRNFAEEGWPRIHPSAVIHESAELSEGVQIGPQASIGRGTKIGKNTVILAGAVVEHDCVIGENCVIHPHAFIGYNTEMGNDVIVMQSAVIGSEGFGFAQDEEKHNHRIPQIGRVVLEDRVRIGALCTIERAAYTETRIRAGAVFDAHCHMAHGVEVGEDAIIMAHTVVAGSTKIGKRVIMSGQTGALDHLNIADDAIFLHRAGITRDVKEPGLYAFMPLMPLTTYLKNATQLSKLIELKKKVADLEKKLRKST